MFMQGSCAAPHGQDNGGSSKSGERVEGVLSIAAVAPLHDDGHISATPEGKHPMKLALLLPNLRDVVTVKELEDLALLAEELDFDSVWAVDRVIVPESNDRAELTYPFGMM